MAKQDSPEPVELPEPVEAEQPICPHCERLYRAWSESGNEFIKINCSCGYTFEVQRVYISRPLEYRR
jgi:glutaredoxin